MNQMPLAAPPSVPPLSVPLSPGLGLGKRVANIVLTAQVQLAYACAVDARDRALRACDRIENSWPATPVRELVLDGYRAQAQSAARMARDVLTGAQGRCGLAFARC